ncbi:uroporphyrinogen-III synthase [uncultured Jatrophihabitans sp.]|uniref:uroporphyrinogen-III synthase n=1 Tax=uncultured Jatrophihabitans sp. TaxID=1610747 RepID=UPI0035CC11D6
MLPAVDNPEPVAAIGALAGFTVGVTAERRREELGSALERRGARIVYGPAIRVVPLVDDTQLLAATKRCLSGPLDFAVATTGVGFRGWLDVADAWGLKESMIGALDTATILTRGPKVRGAVRAAGLREEWSPESESSVEVLEHMLAHYDLAGKRVAIQLHGDPLRDLVAALRGAGADVIEVPVYRWEPPADPAPLQWLIELVVSANIDALTFTSAPAAVNFLRTADELGLGDAVRSALRGPVLAAAVGPVTAAPLVAAGIPVVQPERFRLGALVREVVEALPARALVAYAAEHRIEVRGQAAVIDDRLVPVDTSSMALLRKLVALPGDVVAYAQLADALPGDGLHAVDTAIGQLRTALGNPAIVQTVVKRGYRLAV